MANVLIQKDYDIFMIKFESSFEFNQIKSSGISKFIVNITDKEDGVSVSRSISDYSYNDDNTIQFKLSFDNNFLPFKPYNISCTINCRKDSSTVLEWKFSLEFNPIISHFITPVLKIDTDIAEKEVITLRVRIEIYGKSSALESLHNDGWMDYKLVFGSIAELYQDTFLVGELPSNQNFFVREFTCDFSNYENLFKDKIF